MATLPIEKMFFCTDKSGRGYNGKVSLNAILEGEEPENEGYNGEPLKEWAAEAEEGDEWESSTEKYVCM